MKELEVKPTDKIEIVKQQQKKQTLVLQKQIIPHENHILFEFDLLKNELRIAKFESYKTDIHWFEAMEIHKGKVEKKVDIFNPNPKTKTKVIQEPNCIYVSALNRENAIKQLKKEYKLTVKP